jgi:hypothetical protein
MPRIVGAAVTLAMVACLSIPGGPVGVGAAQAAPKPAPACRSAFPNAREKTIGKTTWYNRQESVKMVLCGRFGLDPSADFPISSGMLCSVLSQVIGAWSHNTGLFIEGSCSGAEIASSPKEPVKYISAVCGWAADLLEIARKQLGVLAAAGCAAAPPVGTGLGSAFESKHEFDVAVDVISHNKCIKYSPTHFGSAWVTEACAKGDKGFKTLPRWRPGPQQAPTQAPGSPGGGSQPGPPGGVPVIPPQELIAIPSTVVAGQSFFLEGDTCPFGSNAASTEILPPGEAPTPASPRNDGTHAGSTWSAPGIAALGLSDTSPDLLPGNYEFVLECFDRLPTEAGSNLLLSERTPLTISEGGRTVQISPEIVAPGARITITPSGPCAGSPGGTVKVLIFSQSTTELTAGHADDSCNWGPSEVSLPADLPPGGYGMEIIVVDDQGTPEERNFFYQPTWFTIE